MSLPVLPRTDSEHANDPLWLQICDEVRELIKVEPMLTDFLTVTILNHSSLESALSAHLGQQIDCASVPHVSCVTSYRTRSQRAMIFVPPCAPT